MGTALFQRAAVLLDRHLETRDWLTGTKPGHADFRMASFLPFNAVMRQLLPDYTPRHSSGMPGLRHPRLG